MAFMRMRKPKKRKCSFCMEGKSPHYLELEPLEGFLSETKRILPRRATGACAKHQRGVTRAIKTARFLALLGYVPE